MRFTNLICHKNSLFVDLGFGEYPTTTIELYRKLKGINPKIKMLGIEIDNERLMNAMQFQQPDLEFRPGGFNLPLQNEEKASIIRCYNVLRQYPEEDFYPAIHAMGKYLIDNGVIIEGTSDQFGKLVSFNVFKCSDNEICQHDLVFGTNFNGRFNPRDFQSVLPRNFIQRVIPGEWIYQFFNDWIVNFYKVIRRKVPGERQIFYETAITLHEEYNYQVMLRKRLLKQGFLVIKPGHEQV